jgi:hypothetical protein
VEVILPFDRPISDRRFWPPYFSHLFPPILELLQFFEIWLEVVLYRPETTSPFDFATLVLYKWSVDMFCISLSIQKFFDSFVLA